MQPQPTTAELAARAGLPRIRQEQNVELLRIRKEANLAGRHRQGLVQNNAAAYPPPRLNKFRSAAAPAPADAPPVLWYWQMTGAEWDRESRSYQARRLTDQTQKECTY